MEHDHPVATDDLADQVFPHMRQSPRSTPIWRRGRPRALMHKFSGEHRPELQDCRRGISREATASASRVSTSR